MSLPPGAAALQRPRPSSCQAPARPRLDAPSFGGAAGPTAFARRKTARCQDGRPTEASGDEPTASSVMVVARRAALLSSLGLATAPLLALGGSLPGPTSQALAAADGAAAPAAGFGFDGLGKSEEQYAVSKVVALAQAGEGAILFLGVAGYPLPIRLVIGAAEAMAVLTAAQERHNKRPATHEAWGSTLSAVGWKVERVAISDIDRDVFFSRVVLSALPPPPPGPWPFGRSQAGGAPQLRSIDVRPSDGIALALRAHAPVFVARKVADDTFATEAQQQPGRPAAPGRGEALQGGPLSRSGMQAGFREDLPPADSSAPERRAHMVLLPLDIAPPPVAQA
eukprot:SM000081S22683  [mRNA]  locus=s81:492905:494414:- [translate_table: standard]